MTAQTATNVDRRHLATKITPVVIIALAGVAARTPLAAAHPIVALLLFTWIVADTLTLALMARFGGKPAGQAVLGALAGASCTIWLGSPLPLRGALLGMPVLIVVMAAIVLGHVAWATTRVRRIVTRSDGDRKERWMAAASEVVPPPLVRLGVAEMTVIHIALFRWGGPADVSADARAFAYHKHLTPMCTTLLILSAIEIAVYHLLVGQWSHTAALVMFVLSDLSFVYLVGIIKSFRFRPVLLTAEGVRVRAGLLIDELIPLDAIVAVGGDFISEDVRDPATFNTALLAWPNIMLRLDRPLHRRSFLRKRPPYVRVAFRLDDPTPFVRLLAWRLEQRTS
jgi:hypothetical protein